MTLTTVKELQNLGYKQLQNKVFHPDLESDLLLAHILKKDRSFLYAHPKKKISIRRRASFKKLIKRRQKGEPFAYLIGQAEFYGYHFKVTPDVLIPRPDTELLVDELLSLLRNTGYTVQTIIDVGTGSGAIIISTINNIRAKIFPPLPEASARQTSSKLSFYAIDISDKALSVARKNADMYKIKNKITFLRGSLLTPVIKINPLHPWLVVANLPYLTPTETRKKELVFEPSIALKGGKKGLDLITKLIEQFSLVAKKGDALLLEIGAKQGPQIKQLVKKYLPRAKFKIKKDYAGFDRVVLVEF